MKQKIAYVALFLTCVIPLFSVFYSGLPLILEWDWGLALLPDQVDNLPLMIHVVGASVFYTLAAIQMLPVVRRNHLHWHRQAGRVAVFAGIASAVSCTWITFIHMDVQGPILYFGRVVFGPLWALFLVKGLLAARRRDFSAHRDWMIRAFAVAMPAGTLVFIIIPFIIVMGELSETLEDSIQSGAWVVHLSIAECLIRTTRNRKSHCPKRSY